MARARPPTGSRQSPAGVRNARIVLGVLLLVSALAVGLTLRAGDIDTLKIVAFPLVAAFVLWAVFSERAEWERDDARRLRRGRRAVPPAAPATSPPAPAPRPSATRRGPQARRLRLRRHMASPLGILLVLACVAVVVVVCIARGCRAWPPLG